MPDNNLPASKPDLEVTPGEFDFGQPIMSNPRMKRRSLKAKPATALKPAQGAPEAARELEREAPPYAPTVTPAALKAAPVESTAAKPTQALPETPREPVRDSAPRSQFTAPTVPKAAPVEKAVAAKPAQAAPETPREPARDASPRPQTTAPAALKTAPTESVAAKVVEIDREEAKPSESSPAQPVAATTGKPSPPLSQPKDSPHGTRPATLYYSSSPRKDKPAAPATARVTPSPSPTPTPMKTTPGATSSSPAVPVRTAPASNVRPATVADFRSNVERQTREQKSVGSILSYIVYALIFLFVVGAGLAGYGTYVLSQQIQQQTVTLNDLDKKYAGQVADLNAKLSTANDALTQSQAQISGQKDLITKQQDAITKLLATTQNLDAAIKHEHAARADETASLRARLRDLEYHGPSVQKP